MPGAPAVVKDYWRKHALEHIMPIRGDQQFPEGDLVIEILLWLIDGSVYEFGCGRGRLAGLFDRSQYLGGDISEPALQVAREANPGYTFINLDEIQPQELFDYGLLYTVALHMHTSALRKVLADLQRFCTSLIIAEIMQPEYAHPERMPPAFTRSEVDLKNIAESAGWALTGKYREPYLAYKDRNITFLVFE
jgi:SAM-dependent methyltransferase